MSANRSETKEEREARWFPTGKHDDNLGTLLRLPPNVRFTIYKALQDLSEHVERWRCTYGNTIDFVQLPGPGPSTLGSRQFVQTSRAAHLEASRDSGNEKKTLEFMIMNTATCRAFWTGLERNHTVHAHIPIELTESAQFQLRYGLVVGLWGGTSQLIRHHTTPAQRTRNYQPARIAPRRWPPVGAVRYFVDIACPYSFLFALEHYWFCFADEQVRAEFILSSGSHRDAHHLWWELRKDFDEYIEMLNVPFDWHFRTTDRDPFARMSVQGLQGTLPTHATVMKDEMMLTLSSGE